MNAHQNKRTEQHRLAAHLAASLSYQWLFPLLGIFAGVPVRPTRPPLRRKPPSRAPSAKSPAAAH